VRWHTTGEFAAFDLGVLAAHTAHPYRLQCEQWKLAEYLIDHIRTELPHVQLLPGWRVASFSKDADAVRVRAVDAAGNEQHFEGAWLIGADGARSVVRSALGLDFEGHTFPETTVLATTPFAFHEHIADLSHINYCWAEGGTFSLLRLPELWRVSLYPAEGESDEQATSAASVQAKLQRILPRSEPYEVLEVRPYRIHQRVVKSYVHGRVLLAGDAAHINSPSGGMGMNGGIHDAFNLADQLHRITRGEGGAELLALYERQRRPVALKHVLEQSGRNRARMQERDPARRRAALTALQQTAADPQRAEAYLLETSMFTGLREAAATR
jgi:2-polyprenyl-6-methoxyphenol hydroxylase-like FAD-dependent oxidoreductase